MWGDSLIRRLSAIAFLGFGIYVALTTWLQVLLEPRGVSSEQAGWLLVGLTLAGVVGRLVVPAFAFRHGKEAAAWSNGGDRRSASCVVFARGADHPRPRFCRRGCGFFLLGALPLLLELTNRRAGSAAASAVAFIWLAGNAGGIIVALLLQALLDMPSVAFIAAAVVVAAAAPLARDSALN